MKMYRFCCIRLVTFISCYDSKELVIGHLAKIQYIFQKRFPWQPKCKRMKIWDASHLNFQYHGSTHLSTKYNVFITNLTLLVKWLHILCLIPLCSLWTNALFWWQLLCIQAAIARYLLPWLLQITHHLKAYFMGFLLIYHNYTKLFHTQYPRRFNSTMIK